MNNEVIAIVGSRSFPVSKHLLIWKLVQSIPNDALIITGCAKGVDFAVRNAAKKNGKQLRTFKADWDQFGRAAGPIRNAEMAEECTCCIAFWHDGSSGTLNMIQETLSRMKPVLIFSFREKRDAEVFYGGSLPDHCTFVQLRGGD